MAARQSPPERAPFPPLAAGADEAGRGCLAGPVVAACVLLPQPFHLSGLGDSKTIPPGRREALALKIRARCVSWGLGVVWPRRIARVNILQASLEAMAIAASWLETAPEALLIDGNFTIPGPVLAVHWQKRHQEPIPAQRAIIKGDALVPAISAASILAKTFRDKLMRSLSRVWPGYGFERHKGYAVPEHLQALEKLGPCPLHRIGFRGVPSRSLLT